LGFARDLLHVTQKIKILLYEILLEVVLDMLKCNTEIFLRV